MRFLDISIMQTRSRDLPRPQSPKKSLSKNGNSLNSKLFNLIATIQLTIHRTTKLCLATFKYVITLEINGFLLLVPSPPLQVIPLIRPFRYSVLTLPSTEMMHLKALEYATC